MVDTPDLNEEFRRKAERYAEGELVFLIDGSGSMPAAYEGSANPIDVAVSYAIDAKRLATKVSAFFFSSPGIGDNDKNMLAIQLDKSEDPMKRFPGAGSDLTPAFSELAEGYAKGRFRKPMHLVIVSDGEIAEFFGNAGQVQEAKEKFISFFRDNPEVMVDILVPSRHESTFAKIMSELPVDNPPRVFVVDSAEALQKEIAQAINLRSGGKEALALSGQAAINGVAQDVTLMQKLRFRRPEKA